jgi:hypothetical protein
MDENMRRTCAAFSSAGGSADARSVEFDIA